MIYKIKKKKVYSIWDKLYSISLKKNKGKYLEFFFEKIFFKFWKSVINFWKMVETVGGKTVWTSCVSKIKVKIGWTILLNILENVGGQIMWKN